MYVELFGPEAQPDNVPDKVKLSVRHLSNAYFLAGDNKMKQYRQPVGNYRDLKFDRFTISSESKCRESKEKGHSSCKEL